MKPAWKIEAFHCCLSSLHIKRLETQHKSHGQPNSKGSNLLYFYCGVTNWTTDAYDIWLLLLINLYLLAKICLSEFYANYNYIKEFIVVFAADNDLDHEKSGTQKICRTKWEIEIQDLSYVISNVNKKF